MQVIRKLAESFRSCGKLRRKSFPCRETSSKECSFYYCYVLGRYSELQALDLIWRWSRECYLDSSTPAQPVLRTDKVPLETLRPPGHGPWRAWSNANCKKPLIRVSPWRKSGRPRPMSVERLRYLFAVKQITSGIIMQSGHAPPFVMHRFPRLHPNEEGKFRKYERKA